MTSGFRDYKYKGFVFSLRRADYGEGWYCDMAMRESDRTVVTTRYWTDGDTHYYTMSHVMAEIRKEIDNGHYKVHEGRHYRKPLFKA